MRQKWAKILELLPNAHISELVSYRNQRTVACPNKMFVSWKCERWKRKRESNKRRNRRGRRANAIPRVSPWLIEVDGWGSKTLGNADSERGKKHHSNTFPFFFSSLTILFLLGHYFPVQETDSKIVKIYVSWMTHWLFVSSQNLCFYDLQIFTHA
jgi:hypothetical protein